jgi:hypothetical protein
MSRLYILFAVIAIISLLAACNNESRVSRLIDASKVTEIRVTHLNTVSVRRPRNLKMNIVREQESRELFLKGCERLA